MKLENNLFKDSNFGYQDTKSFLKTQTIIGTKTKFRCYKDKGIPGPGNYILKNFAEEITLKGVLVKYLYIYNKNKIKYILYIIILCLIVN